MNILFISEETSFSGNQHGGAETSMTLMAQEFLDLGHNVIYLHRSKSKKINLNQLPKKLQVYKSRYFKGSNKFRVINYLNNYRLAEKIAKINKIKSIDIIYVTYQIYIINGALRFKAKYNPKVKIIMRMAGLKWYSDVQKNEEISNQYESIFNNVDSINYVHSSLKKECIKLFKKTDMKVKSKSDFSHDIGAKRINLTKLENYSEVIEDENSFNMIMATRFSSYQKRQDIIIKALSLLPKNINFKMIFVGNGPNLSTVKQMAYDFKIAKHVKFIDFMNQNQLWQLMSKCDLLLHASDYEGNSKILIESMSIGLPALVSNISPNNNLINNFGNGYLAENNEHSWAECISYIYRNQSELKRVSHSTMEYFNTNFDSKKSAIEYVKYFESIIEGRF